ncbi:hypothetical protein LAG90_15380 [Marinilongibacter aquaticus]|uniref:hypothetical protein n=1 Tax=Marinilongibacter aquaticus TaxID=2975157 RepID=UPI0021BD1663|nr:hypothetical protein [Marinilongibacter aquaticus]UBM58188.1 hypothetical protein LAG90_15380 [Marinilongibacter aquaticus]
MKRLITIGIAILFVLTSTVIPLRYIYLLEQQASWRPSSSSSSVNIASNEKLTLKIPIALPYSGNWESPKEAEGLIQHEGKFYTIISKNYHSDTLYVECLQNGNAKEIFNLLSDYVDNYTEGNQGMDKSQKTDILKLLTQHYFPFSNKIALDKQSIELCLKCVAFTGESTDYTAPYLLLDSPPPQVDILS